jgi:hypothetical protein
VSSKLGLTRVRDGQKAFGTNYGLTAKIPKDALKITSGATKEFAGDNGSGSIVHREFCDNCGSFICEYGVCPPSVRFFVYW